MNDIMSKCKRFVSIFLVLAIITNMTPELAALAYADEHMRSSKEVILIRNRSIDKISAKMSICRL